MIALWLQVDLYHESRDKAPDPAELGAISLLHKYHYAQLQTQTSAVSNAQGWVCVGTTFAVSFNNQGLIAGQSQEREAVNCQSGADCVVGTSRDPRPHVTKPFLGSAPGSHLMSSSP